MPSTVCSYITKLIPRLSLKSLSVIERDILDAENFGYGDENIDKPVWMEFLDEIKNEIERRNQNDINE